MSSSFEIANQREKTSFSLFHNFFDRVLPRNLARQLLFFQLIGPCFLFLSSLFGFLYLQEVGYFLPLLGGIGLCLVYSWGIYGLGAATLILSTLLFFLSRSFPSLALLPLLGTGCTIALGYYISFLCFEEGHALVSVMEVEIENEKSNSHRLTLASQQKEEEIKILEEELEKWREDASQRRIEKVSDDQKRVLLEEEMNRFIAQKETLLNESFEARSNAHRFELACVEALNALRLIKEEKKVWQEKIQKLEERLSEVHQALSIVKGENTQLLEGQKAESEEKLQNLERALQEVKAQLEKANNTHENLTLQNQTLLESQVKYAQLLKEQKKESEEQGQKLETTLQEVKAQLEKANSDKEALISQNQVLLVAQTENAPLLEVKGNVTELEIKIVQLEGALNQLRGQFEEKKKTLHITRKELFATTGNLLALEKERINEMQNPDLSEISKFQQLLCHIEKDNGDLEDVVETLENLIFKLISRSPHQ